MGSARPQLPAGCPPEGHGEPDGTYYRYAGANHDVGAELSEEDWLLPVQRPGPHYKKYEDCAAHALSVFTDKDVLLTARSVMPFARKKSIAVLELRPGMGAILASDSDVGPTHHDWWPSLTDGLPLARVVEGRAV